MPTFPNAKVVCSTAELASAEVKANANRAGEDDRAVWQDSLVPVLEAGMLQAVDGLHAIEDGLIVQPTPGHTPGHVVLRAESGGERMLFAPAHWGPPHAGRIVPIAATF